MRKIIAAAALALTLSACTVEVQSEPTADPTPSETYSAPAPEPTPEDEAWGTQEGLDLLRSLYPWFNGVDDALLTDTAQDMCGTLDRGATFDDILIMALDSGIPAEESGAFIAFSVNTSCPEYLPEMDAWTGTGV